MLTAVNIYNETGDVLELPLDASSGYVVKEIEGLGPVKADIVTTEYVGMDGGVYQNAKGNMRNIVLQLGFDPSYESDDPIGELRRALYPYLSPKMPVDMRFITNTSMGTVKILGYVESFEPSIFSADPEIQISVLCPDPYFYALAPLSVSREGAGEFSIINPSTVDTGFIFTIHHTYATDYASFTLTRTAPSLDTMVYTGPLEDEPTWILTFQIITIKGRKSAVWRISGTYDPSDFSILTGANQLGYMNNWINVVPGNNIFNVEISEAFSGPIEVFLSFTPRYVGL